MCAQPNKQLLDLSNATPLSLLPPPHFTHSHSLRRQTKLSLTPLTRTYSLDLLPRRVELISSFSPYSTKQQPQLSMSGRGKGGKGLGKGGAKRHRKIVRSFPPSSSSRLVVLTSFLHSHPPRSSVTTSKASPSPRSVVSLVVAASSVSLDSSTKRRGASSRSSLRTSFATRLLILSTLRGRRLRRWTSFTR